MATKPDKLYEAVKAARQRSGANIGPRQPMSDEMVRRINEQMDKSGIGGKKTSQADTEEGVVAAKKGGAVKKMASGGAVSASRRADGIAQRGKTRGKMC